ncbi:hypothetical protein Arub01_18950 [Actinomadura rubrobrunea]|uniref:Uncharacterized protein n=1 Tax=Actinomadura rubrobrunea TaxID=115335 RepID=A0A9W6PVA8_9ACTN|nr:hypothetical protein Arub01_18950 [Actinomadura rubrobrunea]
MCGEPLADPTSGGARWAVGVRDLPPGADAPRRREDAEAGLQLIALVGLYDSPRPEVPDAVRHYHNFSAGGRRALRRAGVVLGA